MRRLKLSFRALSASARKNFERTKALPLSYFYDYLRRFPDFFLQNLQNEIVCHFASPLLTNFLCPIDGVNGIKLLKCKQQTKKVALKAADFIKVDNENSAIVANTCNKNVALKIELIPVSYCIVIE